MTSATTRALYVLFLLVASALLTGCPGRPGEVRKEAPPPAPPAPAAKKPPVPEITVRVAALDVGGLSRKVEKKDIQQLWAVLKAEQVDILAVGGIVRYPGVSSRTDLVDELASQTQMQKVFGETATVSGRQTGNAVFTLLPVRSQSTWQYERLESVEFASALQAVIDCGPRNLVVVSTHLPASPSDGDRRHAASTLSDIRLAYQNDPLIVAGNLGDGRPGGGYTPVDGAQGASAPRLWYTSNGSMKLFDAGSRETALGTVVVASFGIFRQEARRP